MAVITPCKVCSAPAYDSDVCGLHSEARFSYALGTEVRFQIIDKQRGTIAWTEDAMNANLVVEALNLFAEVNQSAA